MLESATLSETQKTPYPDSHGRYGVFGGQFIPEILMPALEELEHAYRSAQQDPGFHEQLDSLRRDFIGRPTPLYFAQRMTEHFGGAKVYFKREDLAHTGAHKINNALGQVLLAKRMGKERIIAETGAGQHGVATATAAALLGLCCEIYMGEEDTVRQRLNVYRMELLGSRVVPVKTGTRTLKDAINEAMRDWATNVRDTHYILGTVHGPHPYPVICRDFQRVIGRETREQVLEREGRLPDLLMACVGGGSNAIGLFYDFIGDEGVRMIGVEAGGRGIQSGEHAARFSGGSQGTLHGAMSYVLQDEFGQILGTHSVSAGLDYPSVGPEHAWLNSIGRVEYTYATDDEALEGFKLASNLEGIIPALETAHAVAYASKAVPKMSKDEIVVINMSGRGDKDVEQAAKYVLGK